MTEQILTAYTYFFLSVLLTWGVTVIGMYAYSLHLSIMGKVQKSDRIADRAALLAIIGFGLIFSLLIIGYFLSTLVP